MRENADRWKVALHYTETTKATVDGGGMLQPAAGALHCFGFCSDSELRLGADAPDAVTIDTVPGDLFYIPAGQACRIQSLSTSEAVIHFISFRCADASGLPCPLTEIRFPHTFRLPQMKNWQNEFIADKGSGRLPDYFRLQSRLYAIAAVFLKSIDEPVREEVQLAGFAERTRQRIMASYDSALDMEELARSSGAGSSRFYRTFRKHTGLSPLKFLITTRLNASLKLLADPGISVTEAAHSVGYSDEYYFSRLFKKQMGITPTEYAAKAQVAIACLCPIFPGDLAVLGITPRVTLKREWEMDEDNRERYLQEIRLAQPQLMLSGPIPEPMRDELSAIAPVSMFYWYRYSWKKRLIEFGRLLGLTSVAERWLSDFERKTDNARQHVREHYPDTPFLLIGVREGNFRLYGTQIRKFTDLLYDELRFKSPPAADEVGFLDAETLREAAALDCDNALFLVEYPVSNAVLEELEREWGRLKGEERPRRCLFIRLEAPFLYNAAMHERLVDQIVRQLHALPSDVK